MARFSKTQRLVLLAIILLGFGLRMFRLGADSLWYDETVSAMLAAKPLAAMWAHTAGDIHPPLYYGLLHFWRAAAGASEFSLTLFSLWFGVAAMPLIAHLAFRLYGVRASLLAAALVAINPFAIWYAQEARMYTLGMSLLLGVLLVSLDYIHKPGKHRWRLLALYAILAALSLWTLYYSAFALVALNVFVILWLLLRERRRLWPWLAAQVAALALYLPWLPTALRQALDPPVPPWRSPEPLAQLLTRVGREGSVALAYGQSLDPTVWWGLGVLGIAVAVVATRAPARRWRTTPGWWTPALLWTTLVGPIVLILLVTELLSPLYHVRYLFLYSSAYPILLAVGLLHIAGLGDQHPSRPAMPASPPIWRPILALLFVLLMAGGSVVSLRNYHNDRFAYESADDLRGAVGAIYRGLGPRDVVLINAGYLYPAFSTYWPGEIGWLGRLSDYPPPANEIEPGVIAVLTGHVDGDPAIGWNDPDSDFYAISQEETEAGLARVFADANTVWQLRGYDTVNDSTGIIRDWLESHGNLYFEQTFPGQTFVRVQAWRTTQAPRSVLTIGHPLRADFSGEIRLLGYDLAPDPPQPDQPLRLTLYWQRVGPIARSYKVFTQLLAEGGDVVAQDDAYPGRGAYPTDHWRPGELVESTFVLVPRPDLPPGEYQLITGFYDEASGERLPLVAGGDAVMLTTIGCSP